MIRWIISLLKGQSQSEVAKSINEKLKLGLTEAQLAFPKIKELYNQLFGKPYLRIKELASGGKDEGTIDSAKTDEFNNYFNSISNSAASILEYTQKIRKNNNAAVSELKKLSRNTSLAAYNKKRSQTTDYFDAFLKGIIGISSKIQKIAIEGSIAGKSYKYESLIKNLDEARKSFNNLFSEIEGSQEYCKKMLKELSQLEGVIQGEVKPNHAGLSLARGVLYGYLSICTMLGCGSVPKVDSAAQPTVNYSQPKKEPLTEELYKNPPLLTEAVRQYRLSHLDSPPPYDVYVGEIFPLNLDQFFERFYHLKGKEYYINDFSLKNVNPSKRETGVTGEIYFKIEGNLLSYTIPELNKGFKPWLSILVITEDDKRYEVDIHFNVQKRTFVPPNVDKNKTG